MVLTTFVQLCLYRMNFQCLWGQFENGMKSWVGHFHIISEREEAGYAQIPEHFLEKAPRVFGGLLLLLLLSCFSRVRLCATP